MASDRAPDRHNFDFGTGRKAVHSVAVMVPREEWDTYFDQMRRFAKANDLKFRLGRIKPDYDIFFVDLWRENAMLTGGNVFDTPEFHTHIYMDPKKGGTREMAGALLESMKQFVSQVPGVTIKQRR